MPSGTPAQSLPTEWEVLKQANSPQDFDPHHVGTVYHGPSMGRLKGAIINDATQGWFRVADPQGRNTASGTDRPAILDALLQGNDLILHRHRGNHHLLRGIDRIVFHQPMENQFELASYNLLTSDSEHGPVFSSQCFTPDGQAFVTLEGILSYQMKSRDAEIRLPSLTSEPDPAEAAVQDGPPVGGSILRPMLMRATVHKEGMSSVLTVPVDPENDSFFSQHRFRNIPFLPGVMLLEIMGEAAETLAHPGEQAVSMENMRILRGVRGGNEIVSLVVRCNREGNKVAVQLFESERATKPCSEGTVVLGTELLPLVETIPEPHGDFADFEYREDTPILHGPEMQSLRKLAAWRFLGVAKLQCCETTVVDNFPPGSRCLIDPAILDGAIVACGTDAWAYFGNISEVPGFIRRNHFWNTSSKGRSLHRVVRLQDDLQEGHNDLRCCTPGSKPANVDADQRLYTETDFRSAYEGGCPWCAGIPEHIAACRYVLRSSRQIMLYEPLNLMTLSTANRISVRTGSVVDVDQECELSPEERMQASRFRAGLRRHEFLTGRVMVRQAMNDIRRISGEIRILGHDPDNVTSRPIAMVDDNPAGINISITHCDGIVAAAASGPKCSIGIDLVKTGSVTGALQATWMSSAERTQITQSAFPDQTAAMIWAAREAAYKASQLDEGFRPADWDIRIVDRQVTCFYQDTPRPLSFQFFNLSPTLLLVVASTGPERRSINIIPFENSQTDIYPER